MSPAPGLARRHPASPTGQERQHGAALPAHGKGMVMKLAVAPGGLAVQPLASCCAVITSQAFLSPVMPETELSKRSCSRIPQGGTLRPDGTADRQPGNQLQDV